MQDEAGKPTEKVTGGTAAISEFILSLCMSFFFIQAFRDILISPGGFNAIKYIVFVLVLAPIATGLLNFIPAPRFLAFAGAAAAIAGRAFLLQPSIPLYYYGECLVFAGFALHFTGRLNHISRSSQAQAGASAAMFSAGMLTAPILHLYLRSGDKAQSNPVIWIMIALAAASALMAAFAPAQADSRQNSAIKPKASFLAGFSILLLAPPLHYILQWALKPAIFSGIVDIPYRTMVIGMKFALFAAILGALEFTSAKTRAAIFRDRFVSALVSAVILAFLFSIPQGWLGFFLIVAAVSGAVSVLTPVIVFFCTREIKLRPLFLGVGLSACLMAVLVLQVFLIERHSPRLHILLMSIEAAGILILAIASRGHKEKPAAPARMRFAAALAGLAAFFFVVVALPTSKQKADDPGRHILACLYTWYGVPGSPLGDFRLEALSRPAAESSWNTSGASLNVSGGYINFKQDTIAEKDNTHITSPVDAALLASYRTYFIFSTKDAKYVDDAVFFIRKEGIRYTAPLKLGDDGTIRNHKIVFQTDFKSAPEKGPDEMGFVVRCRLHTPDRCTFSLSDLKASSWKHWDEDYHKAKIDGKWRNDPPDTLAAAHRVRYSGKPWPEIEPYSPRGYYDSWEPAVMRSQFKLMEKAGIDTVLIMHPESPDTVGQIIKILDEMHSPLKIAYYGHKDDPKTGIGPEVFRRYGKNPRFLTVGGRPVFVMGKTGLESKPYKVFEKEIAESREYTGAFIIGDQYMPPKEEMLSLLDGSYYYDTTGMHRAGWGAKNIETSQPDGSFITGHGHLLTIFRAISNAVHAQNKLYLATVIPGFDNLAVHGFIDTPFYDGHPGTIVKRYRGRTYAETWKAAIDSRADWACIVSWNELHEGTEIEPTMEDGVFYVNETKKWADAFREGKAPKR